MQPTRGFLPLDSDARLSMSDLARLVGMSSPSVSERIRRLEALCVPLSLMSSAIGYQISAVEFQLAEASS
ncbi:AsnC family protein [Agrobacterium tumefaciens]|uniref:AsnC family protein n=1 Tax=Agrobacterium tumefaciens TaxID=358 RepID=UPI002B1BDA3B|nr:AsnC family protein [Agrobacterium tumefaciens]